ncbi:MAG: hypothetical protein B7Y05_13295 [Polynucleobacter sp. 24-46-87]|jgi:hypothetical protein|nr:MAG: hypothetical protein B7Y05_13295 [Polynucleobacter sp. 24-46-87]OZA41425.1 MAG: hypothetical protein B7X83_02345 [Polynucleobacter sp. 17-46-58]HQT20953.1 cupin-like domain-containing protein [Polynucleobacter sp.]HQT40781.1 cupin-like domain-containing protein [Polynucleobacter sp.]
MIQKVALSRTVGETYRICIQSKTPVIITDVFSVLPNLKKWDLDYASRKIAEKETVVLQGSTEEQSGGWTRTVMRTSEYFKRIKNGFNNGPLMYMAQQNIEETHPELLPLIEFDQLIPKNVVRQRIFWLGPGGTRAPLHMDPDDNFFIQLMGVKTFHLFSPDDTPYLYAHSPRSNSPELSQVKACDIDRAAYPKTIFAKAIQVDIKPGEILFLPAYWWHEVVNGPENSISINLWCHTKFIGNLNGMKQLMPKKIKSALSSLFHFSPKIH